MGKNQCQIKLDYSFTTQFSSLTALNNVTLDLTLTLTDDLYLGTEEMVIPQGIYM